MGSLSQICPVRGCKYWNGEKAKRCIKCGADLSKISGKVWGIDYRDGLGKRCREKIGPNKKAAKNALRDKESAVAEDRHIRKNPDAKTTFKELADWYLQLAKVREKVSYDRDKRSIDHLLPFFGHHLLKEITPALVEEYLHRRLREPSYRGHLTKPATVNRELACLNFIFTNAVRNGKAGHNPVQGVKRPPENNERDRVLIREEYDRLIAECPPHIEPVVKLAYLTGMRRGEILRLTWDQVDLREGFINLPPGAKNKPGRPVPLEPELVEMFKTMPRGLPGVPVFTRNGKPITGSTIREGFELACRRAGIENFTFHDLRHTYITEKDRNGYSQTVIMAATGHKTMKMFRRYRTVDKGDLRTLVEGKEKNGQYLDSGIQNSPIKEGSKNS
jgi:integrase